ncbi:MAG: universal stress protein [Rhizobiales bacterium]|nr:universal stress protein [Hyphomicrobiales bacterium]
MYDHILIPSDGSSLAQVGVDHGLALAKIHGAKVTAVTVTEPFGGQFAFASDLWTPDEAAAAEYDEAQRAIAERVLAPIEAKANAMGIPIETVHIPGRLVSSAITDLAGERGCSVIVMSSHGRTGIIGAMLGSQAQSVATSSTVPVIIAR